MKYKTHAITNYTSNDPVVRAVNSMVRRIALGGHKPDQQLLNFMVKLASGSKNKRYASKIAQFTQQYQ